VAVAYKAANIPHNAISLVLAKSFTFLSWGLFGGTDEREGFFWIVRKPFSRVSNSENRNE
jgi:hypothetical protein